VIVEYKRTVNINCNMYSTKSINKLELHLETEILTDKKALLHASIIPPKTGTRKGSTLVCAIDASGSMGEDATLNKGGEKDLFSRLDLVKHSVKTIIHMLNPEDNICLIPFDDNPIVELPIQAMDQAGKDKALKVLEKIKPMCSTNIWGALKASINEITRSPICENTNNYILLFTDGEPNVNPPKGIMGELKEEVGRIKNCYERFTIHTFGYGYSLDSKLLYDISVLGNGIYNYIPDCTMIGTTFVNFVSNILSTFVANAKLTVVPSKELKLKGLGFDTADSNVTTSSIRFGQTRDFIFKYNLPSDKSIEFSVTLSYGINMETKKVIGISSKQSKTIGIEWIRSMYSRYLLKELEQKKALKKAPKPYIKLVQKAIESSPFNKDPQLEMLYRDIESSKEMEAQVTKAFSTEDWFRKWGFHYIQSLARAHQLQMCHNFKDPSVQAYGGEYFKELQDKTDEIFCTIPAPKPKIHKNPVAQPYNPPPYNMRHYMNYGAGCFDGEGEVILTNGKKKVKDLVKDDEVICAGGKTAKVVALIITKLSEPIELVELKGVKLTPWHPVRLNREWKFPVNVKKAQLDHCDVVYNLILDRNHIVMINGLEVLTLGHGFKDNKVVEHEYFGSQKVIDDMKKFKGWDKGKVIINQWKTIRDPVTQLVQGLIH